MYYILENGEPVKTDVWTWVRWMETFNHKRIKLTKIGRVKVSTVFLGVDHNFRDNGPPILFETITFDYPSEICRRYSTLEEALAGHEEVVLEVSGIRS